MLDSLKSSRKTRTISIPTMEESSEMTLGGDIRCSFSWTIESFKNCKEKNGQKKESETFKIHLPDGKVTSWQIDLYPKGTSGRDDGDISVFLTSNNNNDIRTKFSLSFLDPSGEKKGTRVVKEYTFSKKSNPPKRSWGFASFLEPSNMEEQDKLTIVCDMTVYCHDKKISDLTDFQADLCKDFSRLFSDGDQFSDVEIICGEKTFACHKSILAARSPVFKAMFYADMEENRENKVVIEDFGPKVIENMLGFVYGAKTVWRNYEDLREHVSELLRAADQYNLPLLKVRCEEILSFSLSVDNCLVYLIIADMYQAEKLKKRSMKLLVENMRTIVTKNSEDWKKCVKSHPDLTIEITEELSKRT